ncbi:hypothetical protein FRC20_001598, partial [Serendipita sp. 405]
LSSCFPPLPGLVPPNDFLLIFFSQTGRFEMRVLYAAVSLGFVFFASSVLSAPVPVPSQQPQPQPQQALSSGEDIQVVGTRMVKREIHIISLVNYNRPATEEGQFKVSEVRISSNEHRDYSHAVEMADTASEEAVEEE